jgi:hypothetical protein
VSLFASELFGKLVELNFGKSAIGNSGSFVNTKLNNEIFLDICIMQLKVKCL